MVDVWKVGVSLGMTNNVSGPLAVIAKDVLGLKGSVGEVEKAFGKWGLAIGGAAAAMAGIKIVEGIVALSEHGNELIHVQQQLAAAGVDQVQIAQATQAAWTEANKYGLNVSQVLGDIKEARMVFGSTEHAIEFIDPLEKMRVVLNSVMDGKGTKAADAVYEAARAGELKGLQTPDQFMSYFEGMTKAITASGGKIDPKDFMQATQYGRLASKGWEEEFYTKYLPSMIQEMGPSSAGNSLMSLFGTIVQGKVTKRALGNMEDIGLVEDQSKIILNAHGDPVGFNPGALYGTDLMIKDPFKWSQDILKPLVEKHLGREVKAGDEGAIELLGGLFGNRTSAQAIAALMLEGPRIKKDAGLIGQAQGTGAADQLLANDPTAAMNNFNNAWSNLLTALGSPLVSTTISAMNGLASGMKTITEFAAAHPTAIKIIGEGLVGLGIALAGLGTAAVIAAAAAILPAGAVGLAIAAVGTVILTVVAFNWKGLTATITTTFDSIAASISAFIAKLANIPKMIVDSIPHPAWMDKTPGQLATDVFGSALGDGKGNVGVMGQRAGEGAPGAKGPIYGTYGQVLGGNIQPPAPNVTVTNSTAPVILDGQQIGKIVTKTIVQGGSGTNGPGSFDATAMPRHTGW